MHIKWHEYENPDALAAALAQHAGMRLCASLAHNGHAGLAVSGGATPLRFFEALSRLPLDWAKVIVTLADERWVPETNERSNARLVRSQLIKGAARAARFVPLYNGAASPELGAAEAGRGWAAPTMAVLGMGLDGHTASLFPHAPELAAALDPHNPHPVTAIHPPGQEPRLTLTLRALLAAEAIALHIEGAAKRRVLEEALKEGDVAAMPVRAVLRAVPLDLFWCPD